jgi:hypothetical protein
MLAAQMDAPSVRFLWSLTVGFRRVTENRVQVTSTGSLLARLGGRQAGDRPCCGFCEDRVGLGAGPGF